MISANEIRNRQLAVTQMGYDKEEVNTLLDEAAETVDAYVKESKELYRKLEVLATKIEEYRESEDSIKDALIIAQKMADRIKKDADEASRSLIADSEAKAKATISDADAKAEAILKDANRIRREAEEKADKIISTANRNGANIVDEKKAKANSIIADAEKKANDAISSSKIVAQNILDQAKEISADLIAKSNEEKEAYELLVNALKNDAKDFIGNLVKLYREQLSMLEGSKLESDSSEASDTEQKIASIDDEVESLVSEIEEMEEAIPSSIYIDEETDNEPAEEIVEEADEVSDILKDLNEVREEASNDDIEEIEEIEDADDEGVALTPINPVVEDEIIEDTPEYDEEDAPVEETDEESADEQEENEEEYISLFDDEPADPMEAVAAFSKNEFTPVRATSAIPEIDDDEDSLFGQEAHKQDFENYFNIKRDDPHRDRTQTISLIPPEDDEEDDDEPKFKGFFKKKK